MPLNVCRPKALTREQLAVARRRAIEINPVNATLHRAVMRTPTGRRGGPRRLAVNVGYRWPVTGVKLTVRFLDSPTVALQKRILSHMNAWAKTANIQFVPTGGDAQVRISRLDSPEDVAGYWSYVGTQILGITNQNEPTLNLDSFTMNTPDGEFYRVVRHEAGHTLGFEHEHMRGTLVSKIDRAKAIRYFDETQGWTAEETEQQVLTPLADHSIMGTSEADPISIMCYQIPAEITKNGKAIPGGININPKDHKFAGSIYPKKITPPATV